MLPSNQLVKASTLSTLIHRAINVVYSFAGGHQRLNHDENHGRWTMVFNPDYLPMPPTIKNLVDNWKEDAEFCRQFLQGTNPFQIKFVTTKEELPEVRARSKNILKRFDNSTVIVK